MATKVIMPKLSPTMEEGQISRWLKKEGDKVSMGEPLAEIDTDKATMEMQALANGVLRKILINEGESAPLGQLIAIIGEPDEDISAMLKEGAPANEGKASEAAPASAPAETGGRVVVSPIAARMAAESGVNLSSVKGSGPGGRIIKRDVEA